MADEAKTTDEVKGTTEVLSDNYGAGLDEISIDKAKEQEKVAEELRGEDR